MTGLSNDQIKQFNEEGMLCIPDFLNPQEISTMMHSAQELLEDLDVSTHPKTQFKTGENDHVGDQYFFDSSDKVSYFFDTDAFDENGQLQFPKEQAINKIGHGLHMHNKVFESVTFKESVKAIARDLNYTDPRVLQSMLIFKNAVSEQPVPETETTARRNEVPVHTDGTFLFTKPQTALGFWFALEDCTPSNGCLSYHPGSHKTFPIKKRFVRIDGGSKGCNMIDVECDQASPEDSPEKYKLMECKAGSLILIHNSVLHKSEQNVSGKSRFAYAFHLIDGVSEYDELNWLQVPSSGGANFSKLFEG
ncbi:hypothetical protein JCM33374_g4644 [Metschnikowia sp. JCM 33374]|nr:hypothetical protein JCM33374_g4644 [Metschnikowia sp. JCM 33374]